MRRWLYAGLGLILGLVLGVDLAVILFLYVWPNDIVLWVPLPVIIAAIVWGRRGFPLDDLGYQEPLATTNVQWRHTHPIKSAEM